MVLDTSWIINNYNGLTGSWLSFGRFGLVLTKKLLKLIPFNPYVACFLMLCSIFLFSIFLSFMFNYLTFENKKSIASCIFPAVFLTAPLFAEQFNYVLQGFEVAFAIFLASLAAFLVTKWVLNSKNVIHLILSLAFMVWAFASYQAVVFLYISIVSSIYVLIYISNIKNKLNLKENFFKISILKYISTFIVSYFIYFVIDKLIKYTIGNSSYVDNMMMWGKEPLFKIIKEVLHYVKVSLLGDKLFYSRVFAIVVFLLVIYALFNKCKDRLLFLLANLILVASPFFLSLYLGRCLIPRMQFCYQYVLAFSLWILFYISNKKFLKAVVVVFSLLFAFNQSYTIARLFSTEQFKYEQDVRLANKISYKIEELGLGEIPDYPIILCGHHSNYVPNRVNGEIIGISWFEYLGTAQPALDLMRTLGYNYVYPTEEQAEKGKELAKNMPSWPSQGSVDFRDDLIIVKFSD